MKFSNKVNHENYDFLTSLCNRRCVLEYVAKLIDNKTPFSIYIIDLNKFKQVNDVYGHSVGDSVLIEVGKRFESLESDDILFARIGGDEFACVYNTNDVNMINLLGKKINEVLSEHIVVSQSEFTISASIGVSRFPIDADKLSELLRLADIAMYHSKKNQIENEYLISDDLTKKLKARKKIEKLLHNIDVHNDLFLEFQPIFKMDTDEVIAAEALVRWNHATEGIIYPEEFIPVAEEIDVVRKITHWTFVNSLHQIKEWNEKFDKNIQISINVSNHCIHNKVFFTNLKAMFEEFEVKPEWLSIELKELSLLISPEYMKNLLVSISDLGVEIHIDDFGTDPINLSMLKEFRISKLKIDNKYIENLDNLDNLNFIRGISMLTNQLGIKVLAEGVETMEQYSIVKGARFDCYQGFYKSKPLSNKDFEDKYLK